MAKKKRKSREKIVQYDTLEQINLNAAGLDIGDAEIWVAVPKGRDEQTVRGFGTFTCDLHALAEWLADCGIETVAMESTGVYWIPIYELLDERGFDLYLVNARAIKNVSGRKSDVLDCQWIQQLHTYGLLQASFRPDEEISRLRSYVRQRQMLIQYRSSHVQHMQKALQQMNLKLTNVIKDITGQTGMQILRSILAGERDPMQLAQFRDYRCKHSAEEIAKSLEGNYREEHLFALKQAVELYDVYNAQIAACDEAVQKLYGHMGNEHEGPLPPLPPQRKRRQGNEPDYDLRSHLYQLAGVDLTAVDGMNVLLVQQILSEIGTDMSRWRTEKHFTSWLGLAPNNRISGGRVLSTKTKRTKSRANTAFRIAAQSVHRTDSALGAFYRRMRAKHGAPKAITATARKIAVIVYHMLKGKRPYQDFGASHYEQQYKQRVLKNLKRRAQRLDMELVPLTNGAVSYRQIR